MNFLGRGTIYVSRAVAHCRASFWGPKITRTGFVPRCLHSKLNRNRDPAWLGFATFDFSVFVFPHPAHILQSQAETRRREGWRMHSFQHGYDRNAQPESFRVLFVLEVEGQHCRRKRTAQLAETDPERNSRKHSELLLPSKVSFPARDRTCASTIDIRHILPCQRCPTSVQNSRTPTLDSFRLAAAPRRWMTSRSCLQSLAERQRFVFQSAGHMSKHLLALLCLQTRQRPYRVL